MKPILTIVISTYNRSRLLEENLNILLKNQSPNFCIYVGDNASTDNTWEMLQKITKVDGRVSCKKNDKNLGISNVIILGHEISTKYFINLNDRDFIKPEDIDLLCDFLNKVDTFEICSLYPHKQEIGVISPEKFIKEYNLANHPGYLVYNTEYYKKYLEIGRVNDFFDKNDMINLSNYTFSQLLYNLNNAYYYPFPLIQQPKDRDQKVPQTRKELFGCAYVLPEYHMGALDTFDNFILNKEYDNKDRIRKLILGKFDFAMIKIGPEYFFSTTRSDFRQRNHIENASPWKCFHNIVKLTHYVAGLKAVSVYGIRKTVIFHGIKSYIFMFLRMIKHLRGTIRAIFYKLS